MNRKFMPDADHSSWTPLETVWSLWPRDACVPPVFLSAAQLFAVSTS